MRSLLGPDDQRLYCARHDRHERATARYCGHCSANGLSRRRKVYPRLVGGCTPRTLVLEVRTQRRLYHTHPWTGSNLEDCPSWSWGSVASRVSFFGPVAGSHKPLADDVEYCDSCRTEVARSALIDSHSHVQGQLLQTQTLSVTASRDENNDTQADPRTGSEAKW